jgi:hypothetical protein
MIMQGTTPRALTWSGLFAVLGLSAVLLPLAPTWAQQRPTLEDEFWTSIKLNHEFNDPRFPFLIKASSVDGHTLIDATFKHRVAAEKPDTFDMVVQAKKAEMQFTPGAAIARARLDGVELTNPRPDVGLRVDDTVLEIPFFTSQITADDKNERVVVALADDDDDDDPEPRERGPRAKRDGDEPAAKKERREVRVFRFDSEGGEKSVEALEKTLAELKELAARRAASALDEKGREELERAIGRLREMVEKQRSAADAAKREKQGTEKPKARKPETGPRGKAEGAQESAEARERRAEIERLRAEVAARHKAWMEAQKRLTDAIRRNASAGAAAGPMARTERFELRFGRPGQGPPEQEQSNRIAPRPNQDRRIAELEERLEKLVDEVRSLKKEAPGTK